MRLCVLSPRPPTTTPAPSPTCPLLVICSPFAAIGTTTTTTWSRYCFLVIPPRRRRVVFVCSHFAAHQERVDERNANYNKIVRQLHFSAGSKTARRRQQQEAARGAKEAAAAAALMGQGSGGAPLTGGMPLGGMGAVAGPTGQRGVADEFGRAEFSGSAAEEAEEGEVRWGGKGGGRRWRRWKKLCLGVGSGGMWCRVATIELHGDSGQEGV